MATFNLPPIFPCFFPWIHGPALSSRCILSWPKSTATCGHGRRRADHGLIGICVTTTELMISWYVFFLMGKSPVGESVICFISWGVPQANPNYSDLTVTSMFKAAGTIVKCAMVKTWVKCPELGSSIHIHRNCLILYNHFQIPVLDRNQQLVLYRIKLRYYITCPSLAVTCIPGTAAVTRYQHIR